MSRDCDRCGHENAPDAPACEVCGTPFEFPADPALLVVAAEPTDVQRDLADAAAFESAYSDWLLSQGEEEYRQWKEYVESLPTADEVAAGFAAAGEADPFN